jgi:hypothetical protein
VHPESYGAAREAVARLLVLTANDKKSSGGGGKDVVVIDDSDDDDDVVFVGSSSGGQKRKRDQRGGGGNGGGKGGKGKGSVTLDDLALVRPQIERLIGKQEVKRGIVDNSNVGANNNKHDDDAGDAVALSSLASDLGGAAARVESRLLIA